MTTITEIIPDDLPNWAVKAMAEGRLISACIKKAELHGMTELESEVIQAAIDYIHQSNHGLFKDVPRYQQSLGEAVDELFSENDGIWSPPS